MRIATLLPPKEGFSPHMAGAIGLLVSQQAGQRKDEEDYVIGKALPEGVQAFSCAPYYPVAEMPLVKRLFLWRDSARYAAGAARVIQSLAPQILEVHNRPEIAYRLAMHFPRLPVILYLHNDPLGMRWAKTIPQRQALLDKCKVVCVSHWVQQRFLSGLGKGIPQQGGECTVIPNPVLLAPVSALVPQQARKKTILYAGRLVADKGVDLLLAGWSAIKKMRPDWQLRIIGADRFSSHSPQTPFLQKFLPLAQAAGVQLDGYQPHDVVIKAMAESAMVVVPSRWQEPFGMTALEAMAVSTAVIASHRGGLPEVVGQGGILLNPEDGHAFREALLLLTGSESARKTLAEKGYRQAGRFSLEQIIEQKHQMREYALTAFHGSKGTYERGGDFCKGIREGQKKEF